MFQAVFDKYYDTRKVGRHQEAHQEIYNEHGPEKSGLVDWAPELEQEKEISDESLKKALEAMKRKDPYFDLTHKKASFPQHLRLQFQ